MEGSEAEGAVTSRPAEDAEPEGTPRARRLRSGLSGAFRLIKDNRLFACALAVGAGLRLVAMIGYPGVLWFVGDSFLYLGGALRPRPDLSKTIGYSFFLRALEPLHSLVVVSLLQHLMGLAMAVMVYALARRARLPRWGATLCTLPVLLDGYQIQLEHMLMSDTLFAFLIVAAVTLVMWRERPAWWTALAAGLIIGYAIIVREAGLPLIVVLVAYFLVRWRGWIVPVALAVGCAAPVAAYGAWFHAVNGQYTLTRSTGFYLWGRMSTFSDCAKIQPPPSERAACISEPVGHRAPPGRFVWENPTARRLPGGPVSVASNKLLTDFAINAVLSQPFSYLGTVAKGVAYAGYWKRLNYPGAYTVNFYKFPYRPQVIPDNRSWIPGATAAADVRAYGRAAPSRIVRPFSSAMRVYQRYIYTYGPLLALMLLIGTGGVIRFWRRIGGPVLLPWAVAVVVLLVPIATADFDYRYLLAVLPMAGLAAGLAFAPAEPAHVKVEP
ncbi:MAG: phospholipid carrier-dependent glycosyltransferase [Micromonosporaceae bacterium]